MNRTLFYYISVSLAALVTFLFCSNAAAQTDRAAAVVVPCQEDKTPGRPTLKRRAPTPDTSSSKEESKVSKPVENGDCKPDSKAKSAADTPWTIRFEGLQAFHESDVLKTLREKRVGLPRVLMPDDDVVEKALAAIRELCRSRGYEQVAVAAHSDQASKTVTFLIVEGPRLQIAEIAFEGNRVFTSQDLAAQMVEDLDRYESSRTGYDAEIMDYSLHRLSNYIRSKGYLQAKLGELKKKVTDRGLVITIPVDEGVLYRIGQISIGGVQAIPLEQVKSMLSLKAGEIANGEVLSRWMYEDLKKVYGELGYIQYSAEVVPEFKTGPGRGGIVDFEIQIDEGRRFTLRAIEFMGDNLSQEELRGFFLIRHGDVYNQRLFEESIKQLNETGLFEPIDHDKDADFRANEEEGLVDVAIKLSKRKA